MCRIAYMFSLVYFSVEMCLVGVFPHSHAGFPPHEKTKKSNRGCMYVCVRACSLIIGTGCRVQVLVWSSIAQSVCQRAFSLLTIWCLGPRVQILHSVEEHNLSPFDLNIACLCQSIEINNNKYVYRQSQARKSTDSGVKWAECSLIIGTGCRVQVLVWSSIAQSVCQRAFSLLAICCLGPRVQILHSAEEHNLSPFDLNTACLCQSIEINNKYVYRQSQVRKSTDSGFKWAECSLIIRTGCRV